MLLLLTQIWFSLHSYGLGNIKVSASLIRNVKLNEKYAYIISLCDWVSLYLYIAVLSGDKNKLQESETTGNTVVTPPPKIMK